MSTFTLATLKSAVVACAIEQRFASLIDTGIHVEDQKSFVKALRKAYPDKKWDLRSYDGWMRLARWVEIDDLQAWEDHNAKRTAKANADEPKLSELRSNVLKHYECINTKALKQRLDEWAIPYGKLNAKASWQALWTGCQEAQAAQAA
jgi:hypothetical protein